MCLFSQHFHFLNYRTPSPPHKKRYLQTTETIALNMSPISIDFSATTFVSKHSTARWNNNPRKCTKSQHNLFLSNPSLHVSVQPQSRPATLESMRFSAVRACSAFTYMTARKSDALRQKWKPASTSLSPLADSYALAHTPLCGPRVPGWVLPLWNLARAILGNSS